MKQTKKQMEEARRKYELQKKSPGAAVGASLLLTGLGHAYLGEWGRGAVALVICITLWFIFLGWIVWIVAAIDAHSQAKKHNELLRMELGL